MLDEREGGALLLIDSFTASLRNVGVLSASAEGAQ
jgi:hypothetical protein